jgi:hypothetical protein
VANKRKSVGEVIPIVQAKAAARLRRKRLRKSGAETFVVRKMKDYERWLEDYSKKI